MKIDGCILLVGPFNDTPWFEPLQMEIVNVAPHLANSATFALHELDCCWVVTNLETGRRVGREDSRHAVLKNTKKRLASKTEEDIQRIYAKFPQEFK